MRFLLLMLLISKSLFGVACGEMGEYVIQFPPVATGNWDDKNTLFLANEPELAIVAFDNQTKTKVASHPIGSKTFNESHDIISGAFDRSGKTVVVIYDGKLIRFFDTRTRLQVGTGITLEKEAQIVAISETRCAIYDGDEVVIFDSTDGTEISTQSFRKPVKDIYFEDDPDLPVIQF